MKPENKNRHLGSSSQELIRIEEGKDNQVGAACPPSSTDLTHMEKGRFGKRHILEEDSWINEGSSTPGKETRTIALPFHGLHVPSIGFNSVKTKFLAESMVLHNFFPINWFGNVQISRSQDGANGGVYFIVSPFKEAVVIKAGDQNKEQVLSSIFLSCVGFSPPKMSIIKKDSLDYKSLADLCEEHKLNNTPKSPMYCPSGRKADYLIRIEFIDGASLADMAFSGNLSDSEKSQLTDSFFVELGRLAIFDAFIGNDDRVCLSDPHTNLGNILVKKDTGTLHPIDQECPFLFKQNEDSPKKKLLRKLISNIPNNSMSIALDISNRIQNIGNIKQNKSLLLEEGIKQAYAQITDSEQMRLVLGKIKKEAHRLDIISSFLVDSF